MPPAKFHSDPSVASGSQLHGQVLTAFGFRALASKASKYSKGQGPEFYTLNDC